MPCCDLVDTQMSYRRIDTVRELEHSLVCSASESVLGVVLKPFLRKLLKLHSRSLETVIDRLLEHHRLTVQLFFNLPLRHARFGLPGHCLFLGISLCIVTDGNSYLIRVPSFSDSSHKIYSP
mgnify:CR=1 FL=1